MSCGDESASHYAGCDCHEANLQDQIARLTAERDRLLDCVGRAEDTVDNLLHAMALPLPEHIHTAGLKGSLGTLKTTLGKAFNENGGDRG